MSKPVAIHYQPPDYSQGHFACSVNWANGIDNRWTANVLDVTCLNCKRTDVFGEGLRVKAAAMGLDLGPINRDKSISRHITGKPVMHPHPFKGTVLVDRMDGRFNMARMIIVMGHSVR